MLKLKKLLFLFIFANRRKIHNLCVASNAHAKCNQQQQKIKRRQRGKMKTRYYGFNAKFVRSKIVCSFSYIFTSCHWQLPKHESIARGWKLFDEHIDLSCCLFIKNQFQKNKKRKIVLKKTARNWCHYALITFTLWKIQWIYVPLRHWKSTKTKRTSSLPFNSRNVANFLLVLLLNFRNEKNTFWK